MFWKTSKTQKVKSKKVLYIQMLSFAVGLIALIVGIRNFAHLHIDSQAITSISDKRYFLVNHWQTQISPLQNPIAREGELSFNKLTPLKASNNFEQLNAEQVNPEVFKGNLLFIFENQGLIKQFKDEQLLVKYLVGFPGNKVTINTEAIFIDGVKVRAIPDYIKQIVEQKYSGNREFIIPEGYYFVMGNNQDSLDSMYFGLIQDKQIKGRVWFHW